MPPAFESALLAGAGAIGGGGVSGVFGLVGVVLPWPVLVALPPPLEWLSKSPLPPQAASNTVNNMDAASNPLCFDAFMVYLLFDESDNAMPALFPQRTCQPEMTSQQQLRQLINSHEKRNKYLNNQ
jgi:hypothetical protein